MVSSSSALGAASFLMGKIGVGIYLAGDPSISLGYVNNGSQMLVCACILGKKYSLHPIHHHHHSLLSLYNHYYHHHHHHQHHQRTYHLMLFFPGKVRDVTRRQRVCCVPFFVRASLLCDHLPCWCCSCSCSCSADASQKIKTQQKGQKVVMQDDIYLCELCPKLNYCIIPHIAEHNAIFKYQKSDSCG